MRRYRCPLSPALLVSAALASAAMALARWLRPPPQNPRRSAGCLSRPCNFAPGSYLPASRRGCLRSMRRRAAAFRSPGTQHKCRAPGARCCRIKGENALDTFSVCGDIKTLKKPPFADVASPFFCVVPAPLLLSLPRLRICGYAWFADAAPLLLDNCSGRGLFQGCAAKKRRVASLFAVLGLSAFVGARGCGGGVSPRTTEKKILSRPSPAGAYRRLDKISFLWWQKA